MNSNHPSPSGPPDPAALLALGLATQTTGPGASPTPPPSPAELAAEFPQLEIIELLGRGGMGAVYKARQRDLDRLVALKILRPGLDADPGFAERFTREARALAQLNHPGIVTLYEFGKTAAGRYFILMEFVDGVNLRQLLDAGRLSAREALAIVPPLCDALQYAHDRGLVHRDIKPENLLIDRLGRIKIADFGIAKITLPSERGQARGPDSVAIAHSPSAVEHSVVGGGTPAYMAPEQRTSPGSVDHRADLYALGVVLYQMLTGELPAAGQLQPPSTRVHLDVRLDEIVLRALEKDPARRYAAASEFKTHIETVSTAHTPASPPSASRSTAPGRVDYGFSYRSRGSLFGWPLLHVAVGVDPATGKRRIARGIIAVGEVAQGFVALGGVAMGGFTFGGISLGAFGYGGLVLALFAYGGLGIGALAAFAGLALAPVALGGLALGWYAFGGSAWGTHVSSPAHHDPAAVAFFGSWAREFTQIAGVASFPIMALGFAVLFSTIELARRHAASHQPTPAPPSHNHPPSPSLPLLPAGVLALLLVCYCGSIRFAAENLPERIATHFDMAGRPDGWGERGSALLMLLLTGVGISLFIPGLLALLRVLPTKSLNIPHRDFWLAPERAAFTHARLLREGFYIGAINAAFFWGLQLMTNWAHRSTPPMLPATAFWVMTAVVPIAIGISIIRLYRTFSRPELAVASRPPSAISRALRPVAPWLLMLFICVAVIVPVSTAIELLPAHQATAVVKTAAGWNLDVIVVDQSAWPPQTLSPEKTLPVAGAALALLGSCEKREAATLDDWQTAAGRPHLRLEYPRAAQGGMPDAIVIPLPPDAGVIWTRKAGAITRHTNVSSTKAGELSALLPPRKASHRFGEAREIVLPRKRQPGGYNFEKNTFVHYSPTPESPHGVEASAHWRDANGVDIFAASQAARPAVGVDGTRVHQARASLWDDSADTALGLLEVGEKQDSRTGLYTIVLAPARNTTPETHLYRTRQGLPVLFQIMEANDAGDVLVRYKPILPALPANRIPVELRALDWLDHADGQVGQPWTPDGGNAASERRPAHTGIGSSLPLDVLDGDAPRYLCLWFTHPALDSASFVDLNLLDPQTGHNLSPIASISGSGFDPATADGPAWITVTTSPGLFDRLPPSANVVLRYAVGEWQSVAELPINTDARRSLATGVLASSPAQGSDGRAFIEIIRDRVTDTHEEQFSFVGLANDGRRVESQMHSQRTTAGILTQRYRFDVPLEQLRGVETRKRRISASTWTVPLRPERILTDQRPIALDLNGDTMASIVMRLRRDHGLRLAFEDVDSSPADGVTLGARLTELESKESTNSLTSAEVPLLREARLLRDKNKLAPETLIDAGERFHGRVHGQNTAAFLEKLAAHTPYRVRRLHDTWIIGPHASSRLSYPVTLETEGLTVEAALAAILVQAPKDAPLHAGPIVNVGPVTRGADLQPWLHVRAPALRFQETPADEALARLTSAAIPASVWMMSGYADHRVVTLAPAPADQHLRRIQECNTWLLSIDRGLYAESWRNASLFFRSALDTDAWTNAMKLVRTPLGDTRSRRLRSATPATELPGVPDGRYLVLIFDSSFAYKQTAVETVTLMQDADGRWRPCGYFIK